MVRDVAFVLFMDFIMQVPCSGFSFSFLGQIYRLYQSAMVFAHLDGGRTRAAVPRGTWGSLHLCAFQNTWIDRAPNPPALEGASRHPSQIAREGRLRGLVTRPRKGSFVGILEERMT